MSRGRRHVARAIAAVLLAVAVSGCATSGNFRKGEERAREADWDTAVAYFTKALQDDPDRPDYKISLERAMLKAAQAHMAAAREFDRKGDVENALVEYRKVLEYEPGASHAIARRGELERQAREKTEATRTPPKIDTMRERARRTAEGPILNPTSKTPLSLNFATNTAIQDILKFIGDVTGINVIIEQGAQSVVTRPTTLNVSGVTLEQGLNLVMTANQLWYKVLNDRTILVIQDTAQKRQQYEEQIIRTFYVSHAEPQEIYNMINQIVRIQGIAITPVVSINKTANTITVRGTPNIVNILEKVIQANDRPRAEVIVDIELLEVNRQRAKEFGLNLAQYQIGAIFSPEGPPAGNTPGPGDGDGSAAVVGGSTFNLNTISQGISTADFYLTVPQALVKFLASDTRTRVLAKPQLRGAEGGDLELNLGDEIPVPSTVFGGLGAGGVNTVPISSFTYKNVGVNVKMKPRVTFENEIILEIEVENSTLGPNINVAGQLLPTFGSRKVKTRMRLREGESNLIAGLLREEDRKVLQGRGGPDADPDPQGHPRRHRGADQFDRHRDPDYAAHRADARADAGAPQSDLHRLADEPRPERADAGDRRRAAAGRSGTGRGHAAWHGAAGRAAGKHIPDVGRGHLDTWLGASRAGHASAATAAAQPAGVHAAVAGLHLADAGIGADTRSADQRRRDTARAVAGGASSAPARGGRCRPAGAHAPGQRHDAGPGVPRRRRAVHGADRHQQCLAAVADERLAHLQPGAGPRPLGAGGPVLPAGRRHAVVQPAGRRQRRPGRHLGHARRRCDRRLGHRPARGAGLRRRGAWHRDVHADWRVVAAGWPLGGGDLHSRDGDGAVGR